MISVEEALKLIKDNTRTIASSQVAIAKSLGGILQRDMLSSVNLPLFDQSSMDGYAIRYSDFINNNVIKIKGEVAAGSFYKKKLNFKPRYNLDSLIKDMIKSDLALAQQESKLKNF